MRGIHLDVATSSTAFILVAAMAASVLITACAAPPVVVNADPGFALDDIRSVYVLPFASPDDNRAAARIMTQALREQLRADGIVRVMDQPGWADAYVQGTIEQWVRGGLGLGGTTPTKVRASLALLDPAKRPLWSAVAEQWDPLRLMADGLFARDPSALAPHWVRAVLQHLPGYTVKKRPVPADLVERFLAGESIAALTRLYTLPPQEVEMILRQALAARGHQHEQ